LGEKEGARIVITLKRRGGFDPGRRVDHVWPREKRARLFQLFEDLQETCWARKPCPRKKKASGRHGELEYRKADWLLIGGREGPFHVREGEPVPGENLQGEKFGLHNIIPKR